MTISRISHGRVHLHMAQQLASQMLDRYLDGACWIELALA